jgi:hypothetical protein
LLSERKVMGGVCVVMGTSAALLSDGLTSRASPCTVDQRTKRLSISTDKRKKR